MSKLAQGFIFSAAALFLFTSCGPSEENIQATVDAKLSQAIAAIPTVTPQPTATPIVLPTFVPTATALPTPTPVFFPTPLPTATPIILPTVLPTPTPFIPLTTSSAAQVVSPATVVILASQSEGSGVIYRSDGYILTNQHVVGDAKTVTVRVPGGSGQVTYTGTVVGSNEIKDLAVIHIQRTGLPFAKMGNSSSLQIGEEVVALGYPLGQTGSVSVTRGVLSRRLAHPDLGELLQTDAAINPGNSGGPLINLTGELMGLNQSVRINPNTGEIAQGIGFALAINDVKQQLSQMEGGAFITASNVKFTNSARNYYFEYPSNWQIDSSKIDRVRVFNGDASFDTLTYINASASLSDTNDLRQFMINEETKNFGPIIVSDFRVIGQQFANGMSVNSVSLNYSGNDLIFRSYAFKVGTTLYWVRYSAGSDTFDELLPRFNDIFTSWEFIN